MTTITGKYKAYPYIRAKQEFITQSKNFRATWSNDNYYVYSYQTVIAQWFDGVWYISDTKYSVETAKHQQEIRLALGHKFLEDNAIHLFGRWYERDLRQYSIGHPVMQRRIERIKKEHKKPVIKPYYSWGGKINDRYSYV